MSNISKVFAGLVAVPLLAIPVSAIADSPGQLTGGSNVIVVKDLTQNGSYASSVTAACNDELQYSIRLHNAAYGGLTNVEVQVNLANSSVTAIPAEGASAGTSGNVSVNLPSGGSLGYENGSTVLYNQNDAVIEDLPDTITSSGINIGNIDGSTTEFVNFKAKVSCPTTPPVAPPVTPPTTPPTVTVVKTTTKELVNTGPGDVIGIFAAVTAISAVAYRFVLGRRLNRQLQ